MCGILGFISHKPEIVPPELFYSRIESLFEQMQIQGGSYNNTDASGYWHPGIGVVKGNDEARNLIKNPLFEMIREKPVPTVFMGHTRKTTVGDSTENENNHPLWSDNYILVHNGSVGSDDVTATEYNLPGTVDSNLILAALEKYGIKDWVNHIKGLAAVIIARRDDPTQLWIYRDTRPIFLYKDQYGLWIASTQVALKELAIESRQETKNNLFQDILPIVELPNGAMYNLHQTKKRWVSKYILTKTLPTNSTYTPSAYKGSSATPVALTPTTAALAMEEGKYTAQYLEVCPACLSKGIDYLPKDSNSLGQKVCRVCGNTKGVVVINPEMDVYPVKYRIKTWDDLPSYKVTEILNNQKRTLIELPENIIVLKMVDTIYVYFRNLEMTTDTCLKIDLSVNSYTTRELATIHYPFQNKYITDNNVNWKLHGGRFYYELKLNNIGTTYGFLLTTLRDEYNRTFLSA